MPHFPKPYFLQSRGIWKVQIRGKQHNLGTDEAEAFRRYHVLMAAPAEAAPAPQPNSISVAAVLDTFLAWCKEHRAADTYEWYQWRLELFARDVGAALPAAGLKHFHIDQWLAKRTDWSPGTKHGMARAVQRAFRWALKKGYVEKNPVADYEKARPGKRTTVVSPARFAEILKAVKRQPFRDLLTVTWETGCRPQESLVVEARHVDVENSRWVFPPDESKGELWPRVVYLTDVALEITKRLMAQYPEGSLFRNTDGIPWTTDAVNCCFLALQHRMGLAVLRKRGVKPTEDAVRELIPRLRTTCTVRKVTRPKTAAELRQEARRKLRLRLATQHAPKYCLYVLRHSWANHALARGVDALTVAVLMGHRDPGTLARTYQHLTQNPAYLLSQAKKATA